MGSTSKVVAYRLPAPAEESRLVTAGADGASPGLTLDLLYRNYAPPLLVFCRSRLTDAVEAEDACHETILRAHRGLARFRSGEKVWPWLSTIAANVCRDLRRRQSWLAEETELADTATPGPEEEVSLRIRRGIVDEALMRLPEHSRSLLYHREFEGWSYDELARFAGTSVASVRSALFRARRLLRTEIEQLPSARGNWPLRPG